MLLLKNLNTKTQKTIQKHEDTITSIAFSPNETIFASASSDATIKIWDYKTTNVKNTVTLEEQTGISKILISFNPQGTVLAIGYDETLLFLNPTTGMQIKEVFLIPDDLYNEIDIQSIAFSPDGNTLAVGTDSNNIILLEIPTIEKVIKARQTRWKQERKKKTKPTRRRAQAKKCKKNRQKALQKKLWEKEKDEDVVIQQSGQPQRSTQAITQPQPIQKTWWQRQWARYTPKRIQRWFKTKSTIKALGIGGTAATIGALYYFRKPIGKTIYKWIKR